MKKIFFFFLALMFLISCRDRDIKFRDTRLMKSGDILDQFMDPGQEYRTVPFWVWNEKITKKMIDEQLPEFANKGFGGVFVHPRYGLITEYASDEWYDLVKYSMEKARELGMKLWLYDENSFPSGFAGGLLPAEMPESYENGVAMEYHEWEVFQPDTGFDWIGFYRIEEGNSVNITGSFRDHLGEKGNYYGIRKLYWPRSKWFGGFTYADLIYPGVTEKFIEITMTGYEETIGGEFGKMVPGVFTDEPNISPRFKQGLRWTPDLFEQFEKRWSYRLEDHLVSLFQEKGDWRKVRHNYYAVLLELFIERWSIPWNEYTEEKDLKWTGHYWEHGWPSPVHGGDNMAMYPYHQIPGIDMLFNSTSERPDQFGNVRAVKELSSIANQFGRHRTLSETYGGSGYELSFEDMKRNGDWQYALGVNLMNQHLSYGSMLGDRKHDFPQTFSYHTAWWEDYRGQADYFARLSLALSSGYQLNKILVIEPTTTAWMHYTAGSENRVMHRIGDSFHDFVAELEYNKIEYDLASEKTMRDFATVSNGELMIEMRNYPVVVLPYGLSNLDSSTLDLLEKFLESGGILYNFSGTPGFVDGKASDRVRELFDRWPDNLVVADAITGPAHFGEYSSDLQFDPLDSAEKVYFMRRRLDNGEIIFLANFNKGDSSSFSLGIEGMRDIVELDPVSGEVYEKEFVRKDGKLQVNIELEDAGSRLFLLSKRKIRAEQKPPKSIINGPKEELFVSGIERMGSNVLALDYCSLEFPGEPESKLMYFYKAHDKIYQEHGFADNPWVHSSQFKTELIDRDTFGLGTGFAVRYPFRVRDGVELSSMKLAVERPELYSVMINGKEVNRLEGEYYMDKGIGLFDIGEHVKPGLNKVELEGVPFSVHHELAPVFITGNFSLEAAGKGWVIGPERPVSLGSWKDFGMPFYPGKFSYHLKVDKVAGENVKLVIPEFRASAISLRVNDSDPILMWPPYEKDISRWLKEGENKVEIIVTGSLKNLVGPHHNVTRKGIVTPWSFKYAPVSIPPGNDYDFEDYGLFKTPYLVTGKKG